MKVKIKDAHFLADGSKHLKSHSVFQLFMSVEKSVEVCRKGYLPYVIKKNYYKHTY